MGHQPYALLSRYYSPYVYVGEGEREWAVVDRGPHQHRKCLLPSFRAPGVSEPGPPHLFPVETKRGSGGEQGLRCVGVQLNAVECNRGRQLASGDDGMSVATMDLIPLLDGSRDS